MSLKSKVACWAKELPSATITSLSSKTSHAALWPLSQKSPMASGCSSSTMPLPSMVVSNGIWKRSMKRHTASWAPLRMAPKPARRATCFPASIDSARKAAAASIRAGSGSTGSGATSRRRKFFTSMPRAVMSSATATWTGPGRPSKAMRIARSSVSMTSSGEVIRKLAGSPVAGSFFVTASKIMRESGVRTRPEVSFSAPLPSQASVE